MGILVPSKKERKYPYFVSLFNIGPYDRKKQKNLKKFQGGGFTRRP